MSSAPILPVYSYTTAPFVPPQRQFGNPTTLGVSAFATTTLVLSIFNTGIPSPEAESVVVGIALFYGGFVQMIAGIWELIVNNTFGGTVFLSYGAFWMSFAYFVNFLKPTMEAAHVMEAAGIFLLAWTIFTAIMLIGATQTNVGLLVVFALLEVTFILLTGANFAQSEILFHVGGWFGVATAVAAYYVAAADLFKETWSKDLLPLGPLGKKTSALDQQH